VGITVHERRRLVQSRDTADRFSAPPGREDAGKDIIALPRFGISRNDRAPGSQLLLMWML